jgi:beta-glucosidase-like glycosyl hydrolase
VGILLLLILLFWFNYWFFSQKGLSIEDIFPPREEPPKEEEKEPEEPSEKPEIVIPSSLISVEKTITFEITEDREIADVFGQVSMMELPQDKFARIIIKNVKENRLVTLENITQAFQIDIPKEVLPVTKTSDFTLLVYPQKEGKRGALVFKIEQKQGLSQAFESWEAEIERDGLFISQNKVAALSSSFKDYSFHQIPFRFLTISKNDSGVCYTLFGDYFVLTSSFASMEKMLEKLKAPPAPVSPELKDQIGQLFIVGFQGKTITPQLKEFFKKYKPGGILLLSKNIESQSQLKTLINELQELSQEETGFPLFIAVDQEGEPMSRIEFLQEKTAQSAITNTDEAYNVGLNRGKELKDLGINLNLAPVLDDMQSEDFYYNRSFQKSTELMGELAKSIILGQKDAGILTAVKHFPGYVGVTSNPESSLVKISLPETSQFQKAMEANPEMVMASNAVYPEIDSTLPFTFSSQSIQFLKTNLGSDALIISDDLAQNSLLQNFSLKEIVTKPTEAGIDILIFSGWRTQVEQGLDTFLAAVADKEISEERINESISKIIQLKGILLK